MSNILMGFKGDKVLEAGYIFVPYIPLQVNPTVGIPPIVVVKTYGDDEVDWDETEIESDLGFPDILDIRKRLRKKYGSRLKVDWLAEEEDGKRQIYLASQPSITDTGMSPRKRIMRV